MCVGRMIWLVDALASSYLISTEFQGYVKW